jgi:hypothetical protein
MERGRVGRRGLSISIADVAEDSFIADGDFILQILYKHVIL